MPVLKDDIKNLKADISQKTKRAKRLSNFLPFYNVVRSHLITYTIRSLLHKNLICNTACVIVRLNSPKI